MGNSEIIEILKLTSVLLELHDENVFKIKGYSNAVYNLEKRSENLSSLTQAELEQIEGVGKSIAGKINEINTSGRLEELNKLLEITPVGVVDMLSIKGIGPKKIRTIWKELNIESKEQLLSAIHSTKNEKLNATLEHYITNDNKNYTVSNVTVSDINQFDGDLSIKFQLDYAGAVSSFGKEL